MESSAFKEEFEEIRKLSLDPETVQLAIRREIALRDHIQRLEDAEMEGMEKGKEQTKVEIILRMVDEPLPMQLICNLWDLSPEEVQDIIDSRASDW